RLDTAEALHRVLASSQSQQTTDEGRFQSNLEPAFMFCAPALYPLNFSLSITWRSAAYDCAMRSASVRSSGLSIVPVRVTAFRSTSTWISLVASSGSLYNACSI